VERRIQAHDDDVNAVCYLDGGGQVLLSGSDDSLIKIWDLRERSKQPQGVLSGHLAGITSLAVREDGMTIASNSKDQSLKIWDVRKMQKANKASIQRLRRLADFDYRFIYAHRRVQDARHEQQHPQGNGRDVTRSCCCMRALKFACTRCTCVSQTHQFTRSRDTRCLPR
jgi:hypothetical protein